MKILTSSFSMDPSGVPTYTVTMVRAFEAFGHTVEVFSPEGGKLASQVTTHDNLLTLTPPDVILAQHTPCAYLLKSRFPDTPFIYSAHGYLPEIDQPPTGIRVDRWTAINERVRSHLFEQGIELRNIDIVRDFVDLYQFSTQTPLRPATPRVLFISNYKKWQNWTRLSKACEILGYPLRAIGSPYGRSKDVAADINDADLVVSWGRGILEGMACGRAVMSFDKTFGDGYLTESKYFESRRHQFSAEDCTGAGTVEWLVEQLSQYNPADGLRNRMLAETYHSPLLGAELLFHTMRAIGVSV